MIGGVWKMANIRAANPKSKKSYDDGIKDISVSDSVGGKTVSQGIEDLNVIVGREKRKLRLGKS